MRGDLDPIIDRLTDPDRPVDILVNDAGFGLNASLLAEDTTIQERAMAVMCTAVLILAGAAGRSMKARGQGIIITVSSVSAWIVSTTPRASPTGSGPWGCFLKNTRL